MWEVREKEKKRGCCVNEERNGGERGVQGRMFYEGALKLKLSNKFWPYSTACGTLFPRQVIEPTSPALEGRVLTTGPPGKPGVKASAL